MQNSNQHSKNHTQMQTLYHREWTKCLYQPSATLLSKQVVRFLEDDDRWWWKWWWFPVCERLFTKVIESKFRQDRPLGCFLEQLLKNQSSKHRRSRVSPDRPSPMWPGRQAMWSDCLNTISIPYHVPQEGRGFHRKGKCGGFSSLNDK